MKSLVAILILVITAVYVLPVGKLFNAISEVTCKCDGSAADDDNTPESKKETGKEFISISTFVLIPARYTRPQKTNLPINLVAVHYTVETPPPNQA